MYAPKGAIFMKLESYQSLISAKLINFGKLFEFLESYFSEKRNILIAKVYVDEDFYRISGNQDLAKEIVAAGFEICAAKNVNIKILNDGFSLPKNIQEFYLLSGYEFFSKLLSYLITYKFTRSYVVYPKYRIDKELCDSCTEAINLNIEDFRLIAASA